MNDEATLRAIVVMQMRAINQVGEFLAELGQSRSKYADEAWAYFSLLLSVAAEVNALTPTEAREEGRVH